LRRALSSAYAAAARWRRRWHTRHPQRSRRLDRPVISIGNLRVGGAGKTPVVAHVAKLLLGAGERPAILSRGYGRRRVSDGATVVSDGSSILADVDESGDEPLMLARELPGVAVVVGADRYLSGCLAQSRLGATVHILDDGFQHFGLARDADLLVTSGADLADRPLPAGRLREPLDAAASADAVLVATPEPAEADRVAEALGVGVVFRVLRALGQPETLTGEPIVLPSGTRVLLVAGIASPDRFFADVASAGLDVAATMTFRDHHWFSPADVDRIAVRARTAGAGVVLTTQKDAVRMAGWGSEALPIGSIPLRIRVEPAEAFENWLLTRIRARRDARVSEPARR
jgi:tetraacyldisaccharide 4'-kinase